MSLKKSKGMYGYREYHKKVQIILIALLAAAILVQLGARYFTESETFRIVLTVSAILTVLPAANLLSPLIAGWRYHTPSEAFHQELVPYQNSFPILYDLIITSKEQIIPADAAAIHPTGVYLYCPAQKVDAKKGEKFLNEMLVGWKLDGNARIIKDEKTFLKRVSSLKPVTAEEDDGSSAYVEKLLESLSM